MFSNVRFSHQGFMSMVEKRWMEFTVERLTKKLKMFKNKCKFGTRMHFFKYIIATSIYVLFDLPLFLENPLICIKKIFLTGIVAGLHWTSSNHLKEVSLNLSPIDAISEWP